MKYTIKVQRYSVWEYTAVVEAPNEKQARAKALALPEASKEEGGRGWITKNKTTILKTE